jgi:hypothetical protein
VGEFGAQLIYSLFDLYFFNQSDDVYVYIKLLVCDNDNMIWNWSRGIFCFVFVLILETINENFGPSKKRN